MILFTNNKILLKMDINNGSIFIGGDRTPIFTLQKTPQQNIKVQNITKSKNIISKEVDSNEFFMTMIISYYHIAPAIYLWTVDDDNRYYTIYAEKYSHVFDDLVDPRPYKEQIIKLYQKLHSLGIIHNDLHSGNIVANGNDVRLIDFDESIQIGSPKNIDKKRKANYYKILRSNTISPLESYKIEIEFIKLVLDENVEIIGNLESMTDVLKFV